MIIHPSEFYENYTPGAGVTSHAGYDGFDDSDEPDVVEETR